MPCITNDSPSINANFAATVLNRAAELIDDVAARSALDGSVIGALQQARDEFLVAETRKQKSSRTYGLPWLQRDLGEYVKSRYPEHAASFIPISDWNDVTSPGVMARTLREAALPISRTVAERTRWAAKFDAMTEQESAEYELMRKAVIFLRQQGLTVRIAWDRENLNDSIDYRGTVDGVDWAFELTELCSDAKGSRLTIGHSRERESVPEQLAQLAAPLPQVSDGPDNLQKALNEAAEYGSKASKLKTLDGAKYCLLLHNRQFLYAPDWQKIVLSDFSVFDAVLVLHQEIYPLVQTWEIMRNGFAKPLRSHNVNDLGDIIAFKSSNRTHRSDPERVKSALRRLEALDLTEDDVLAAIAETRAKRSGQ